MSLEFGNYNFEIFITDEDPRLNTRVRAIPRFKPVKKIKKTKEGIEIHNTKRAIVPYDNHFMERLINDENLLQEFLGEDNEIDLELTGKKISRTFRILLNQNKELCYNFTEYEIQKDREGRIIPCIKCGEIFCKHQMKERTYANVNVDEQPLIFIKPMMIDKLQAIKKWSFGRSYQLRHVDGLTYKFCYELALRLHNENKMVLMAPIRNNKPQKIVIRNNTSPFFAWLEGRIKGNKYALLLHRATLKIVD